MGQHIIPQNLFTWNNNTTIMGDDIFDRFLKDRGHKEQTWVQEYNKKQCPECGGIHDETAEKCTVCGWNPKNQ